SLVADWYSPRPSLLAIALRPLSLVFGALVAVRRALYRSGVRRSIPLPVPVVIVGNITVGGSGKTPLVASLVEALSRRGFHPGVVSRGHGRRTSDTRAVAAGDDARDVGDEPLLLAASGAPVFVGKDRAAAARALIGAQPEVDVIVADDGLQHYALERNVEIAVIDAVRELGNGLLLPAGPLREPPARLDSVDAIVWRSYDGVPRRSARHAAAYAMTLEALPWVNLREPTRLLDANALAD